MANSPIKLLIAASGTGGHLFPALALAEQLPDYHIEWLGVSNRLETQLVPAKYPLNTVTLQGFQQRFGLGTMGVLLQIASSTRQVRQLLAKKKFHGIFTTGGYIASPAIVAARSLGLPVILHESNALPGKVTRWLSPWCSIVALGFERAAYYLPRARTSYVGTPVRAQFRTPQKLNLPIPEHAPLIVVVGGSQGAVAVNQLVRECAPAWFDAGAWVVHLTGEKDADASDLQHPQYFSLPFYDNMAGLFQRTNLAISRAGAATLTELAVTRTPAILIPYPYAAEDHQLFNAEIFANTGAALVFRQAELTPSLLENKVLDLLRSPTQLQQMAQSTADLAVTDSAERLAALVSQLIEGKSAHW